MGKKTFVIIAIFVLATLGYVACSKHPVAQAYPVHGVNMPRVGMVDERFQSFNVEMIEVTSGRFWWPYKDNLARDLTS